MTPIRAFEVSLGIYTLRLATADEADVLARHRASMFRDMGEIDEQGRPLYEDLGFEDSNEMRIELT